MSKTEYDYDKLFMAYEECRSDNTSHFRKILELQKELAEKDAVLKFYSLKSNYYLVDEGRDYCVDYKCYELDETTYSDLELGTKARQVLQKYRKSEG